MIVAKIAGRFHRARERGVGRSARMVLEQAALEILRLLFGFDPWHARSPTSCRPYREGLAALVSGLRPQCVVEVGCGLGSILSRVNAPKRIGYDTDRAVLRAARFRCGRTIRFREGSFAEVAEPEIDVLIAVCWLHDFPPALLEAWLVPLLPRVRHLLVDRVERSSPLAYRHYHDFAFLRGRAVPVRVETFGEQHRQFILYEIV